MEFDRFVADTAETLLRAAYLIAWDFAEAEDLVQECLFQVARRWPRVHKMEHPAAYARTMLVHLALDGGKRRSRRRAEIGPASASVISEREDDAAIRVLGRVDATTDLLAALGELPPRQRVALVLRYFEDLSEAEVATAMDCSLGTVKSTTSRALDRLRGAMDRPGRGASTVDDDERANTRTKAQATEGSTTG
ncbi:MAG TPA: SigE family RNA polymerase sigma factor [Acidimicrobiales bacterium]